MRWTGLPLAILFVAISIMVSGQSAQAKNRLTDPLKIARECKSELDTLCKGVRPGGQRMMSCLKSNALLLSPACSAAVNSTQ